MTSICKLGPMGCRAFRSEGVLFCQCTVPPSLPERYQQIDRRWECLQVIHLGATPCLCLKASKLLGLMAGWEGELRQSRNAAQVNSQGYNPWNASHPFAEAATRRQSFPGMIWRIRKNLTQRKHFKRSSSPFSNCANWNMRSVAFGTEAMCNPLSPRWGSNAG